MNNIVLTIIVGTTAIISTIVMNKIEPKNNWYAYYALVIFALFLVLLFGF